MEIDFNEQCEVPPKRLRFYATYELEQLADEPDVNYRGGSNIVLAEYTVELVRRRGRHTKLVTSDESIALLVLTELARELCLVDPDYAPFEELTHNRLDELEAEALEAHDAA